MAQVLSGSTCISPHLTACAAVRVDQSKCRRLNSKGDKWMRVVCQSQGGVFRAIRTLSIATPDCKPMKRPKQLCRKRPGHYQSKEKMTMMDSTISHWNRYLSMKTYMG